MTFLTGSITNANPGPTLYAIIETAALALGYTLDDTVVIGGNTHKILKSAAAGNTYTLDWFLDINYPTTGVTGGIRFAPFEGYTAATDVGMRGPYSGASSTVIDATTYSRFGATGSALETNWTNATTFTGLSLALSVSATSYWISITRDRIMVMLSTTPSGIAYAGFYTANSAHVSWAGAALYPLIMTTPNNTGTAITNNSASTTTLAFTRIPKAPTATVNWATSGVIPAQYGLAGGAPGVAVNNFTGETLLVPMMVQMGTSTNGTTYTGGAPVGVLDGMAQGYILSSAIRGDSVTIGADTWYATTPSAGYALFMKGV